MVDDSLGSEIVTNLRPQDSDLVRIDPTPTVRIAQLTAGSTLHKVIGAGRLDDGSVGLLNGDPIMMSVHDRSGVQIRAFSGRGHGPGEFRAPVRFLVLGGDTLLGWDAMFGAGYGFTPEGALVIERHTDLARVSEALGPGVSSEDGLAMPGAGHVVKVMPRTASNPGTEGAQVRWERSLGSVDYALVTEDYRRVDLGSYAHSLTSIRRGRGTQFGWVGPMYFYLSHVAISSHRKRIFLSDALEYRIDEWDTDGNLIRSIRKPLGTTRLADSVFQAERAAWRARYKSLPDNEFADAIAELPSPEVLPPILGLAVDTRGWLWVREGLVEWSVFDESGRWLTSVTIPLFKVFEIGPDFVLGLRLDADEVESVVELPLRVVAP